MTEGGGGVELARVRQLWQLLEPLVVDLLGDFLVAVLSSGLLPSEATLGVGKV